MKYFSIPFLMLVFAALSSFSQTVLFEDDFESGSSGWIVSGDWDVTDEYAVSGSFSFTDSPYDDIYTATVVQTATMSTGVDLTTALDADVKFYAIIDLEEGFDFVYLDVTTDGGSTWTTVSTFNGEGLFDWTEYVIPLGGFVGYPDVRLRFRFDPDDFVEYDGMYIDDLVFTKYNIDNSPPLIVHTPSLLYEGPLEENYLNADIIDISGISVAELWYSIDGASYTSVDGVITSGDNYLFIVPEQEPGAVVDYYITATDDYTTPNTSVSDTARYVAGNYITYDDASVDFVYSIGDLGFADKCAVKFTFDGTTDLVGAVIRDYIDPTRTNDSMTIHVWEDSSGFPGADVITPFTVWPMSTFEEPYIGSNIDLRPYAFELSSISGDYFIGYTSDSLVYITYTSTGLTNRTYYNFSGTWYEFFGDFHIRAITSSIEGAPVAFFTYDAGGEPVIAFSDASTSFPDEWVWDFGDGTTSTAINPVHEFLTNGTFNVCLSVTNEIGSDTYCEFVTIDSYLPPEAEFSYVGDPIVTFTDLSTNEPTSWNWIFDDGVTSSEQNPEHTYTENGDYYVCMSAFNAVGGDTKCYIVSINTYEVTPVADFTFIQNDLLVEFTDASMNTPTFWSWDFGDGQTSDIQDPIHLYSAEGEYEICLTSSNGAGSNTICKTLQVFNSLVDLNSLGISISPNPADKFILLHCANNSNQKLIEMFDVTGKLVTSFVTTETEIKIDAVNLPEGIYHLKVENAGQTGISPVVVSH
ncbi:MAG: PKD domain-containing protein [Chitinophagales bacterium]